MRDAGAAGPSGDALEHLVAALRAGGGADLAIAEAVAAAAGRWRTLPGIQITGRTRAGRTTVANALALLAARETDPVDDPERPDPVLDADLVLYVLASTPSAGDRRVLATLAPERVILLVNKADAVGARWADAVRACEQYTQAFGMPAYPIVGALAARTRSGVVTDADMAVLRRHIGIGPAALTSAESFTSPAAGPDTAERAALLDRWSFYGVSCALAALERQPDLSGPALLQVMHAASGIDPVHRMINQRYNQMSARRAAALIDELHRLAARAVPGPHSRARELIADYLRTDDAHWLGLVGGLVESTVAHLAAGYPDPQPADADDALARALRWRAVVAGDMPPAARRAALRVHNGYVRIWERLSRAGL